MKRQRKHVARPTFDDMPNAKEQACGQALADLVIAHYQGLDPISRYAARVIVDPAGDGLLLARSATGSEEQLSQQLVSLDRFCTDEGRKPRLVIVSGAPSTRASPQYLHELEEALVAPWCRWAAAYDVTRYGRVTKHLERLVRSAQQNNVELWTVVPTIDLAAPSQVARLFVASLVQDARQMGARTRLGRARRRNEC